MSAIAGAAGLVLMLCFARRALGRLVGAFAPVAPLTPGANTAVLHFALSRTVVAGPAVE
jgi:hypothetical protein